MRNVNISYGERQIFKDLNWTIRSGEKWNVTGPNGSGKSTLLSLVNADNPRAYSLDITLFDHRRGTGESIWDIKRHIGFLSSEMHSSFITSEPVIDIIRSGLGHSGDGHYSAEAMKGFATGVSEGGDRLSVREHGFHAAGFCPSLSGRGSQWPGRASNPQDEFMGPFIHLVAGKHRISPKSLPHDESNPVFIHLVDRKWGKAKSEVGTCLKETVGARALVKREGPARC